MSVPAPTHWWDSVAADNPLAAQAGTPLTRLGSGGNEPQTKLAAGPNGQNVVQFVHADGKYQEDLGAVLFDPASGTCSFSAFVNAQSFAGSSPIVLTQADDSDNDLWAIVFDSNRLQAINWVAGSPFSATHTGTFTTSTWYHLVVVWSAGLVSAWINGAQVLTGVTPGSISPLPVEPDNLRWSGDVSNVGVWQNVAMDQSQVDHLYNGGLGRQYNELTIEADTLGYNDHETIKEQITLPAISTLFNGWHGRVSWVDQVNAPTVTTTGTDVLAGSASGNSVQLYRPGQTVRFEASTISNRWMVSGAQPSLEYTDVKTTAYTAKPFEFVLCDASAAGFTVNFPANPVHNAKVAFKKADNSSNTVTLDGNGNGVELRTEFDYSGQVPLLGEGECIVYQFDGTNWLRVASDKQPLYIEAWQFASVGAGDVIQWTFVPLWSGQVPVLAAHANGLFTFNGNFLLSLQLNVETNFIIAANNADADYTLTPRYTGTGTILLPRIIDAMSHSRIDTFEKSAPPSTGTISVFENDTLDFTFVDVGTGGSSVDLTAGFLQVALA